MAFTQFHLTKSVNQSRGIFDKYMYRTEDTVSDVLASGYFTKSRYKRDEFDEWSGGIVDVECSDGFFVGRISENGNTISEVLSGSGGGGGGVQSVTGGDNVTITGPATDPIVNASGVLETVVAGTNVTIDATDPANPIISASGGAVGGQVDTVVAGTAITVDDTDPVNPIINVNIPDVEAALSFVQTVSAGADIAVDNTDPQNPIISFSGTAGGQVDSVVAGSNVQVDDTDPENPVVSSTDEFTGTVESVVAGDSVTVDATDPANPVVGVDPTAFVASVSAGADITVDNTDPQNPIISFSGTQVDSVVAGTNVAVDNTDPANPEVSSSVGVQNSGAALPNADTLNFTGSGVTASDAGGGVTEVNIVGGAGGQVDSVVGGTDITVDATDPGNPIVNFSGTTGGQVDSVVGGTNVTVDNTDPANPIVNVGGPNDVSFDDGSGLTWASGDSSIDSYAFGDGGQALDIYSLTRLRTFIGLGSGSDFSPQVVLEVDPDDVFNNQQYYVSFGTGVSNIGVIDSFYDGTNTSFSIQQNGTDVLTVDSTGLTLDYGIWPAADGTADQVLTTDGAGVLSWTDKGGGGGDLQATLDLGDTAIIDGTSTQLEVTYTGTEYDGNLIVAGGTAFLATNNGTDGSQVASADTSASIAWNDTVAGTSSLVEASDDGINLSSTSGSLFLQYASWPLSDGTAGQVLSTNANGTTDWVDQAGGGTLQDLQSVMEEGSHASLTSPEVSASITCNDGGDSSFSTFELDSGDIKIETINSLTPSVQGADASPLSARLYYSDTSTEQTNSVTASASGVNIQASSGPITLNYADWPAADGTVGQVLSTNADGTLDWVDSGGGATPNLQQVLEAGGVAIGEVSMQVTSLSPGGSVGGEINCFSNFLALGYDLDPTGGVDRRIHFRDTGIEIRNGGIATRAFWPTTSPNEGDTLVMGASDQLEWESPPPISSPVPALFAYRTSNQSIPSGTQTNVNWSTVSYDPYSILSGGTDITIPSGFTHVRLTTHLQFAANSSGARIFALTINGNQVPGGTSHNTPAESGLGDTLEGTSAIIPVSSGDVLSVFAFQSSGSPLALQSGADNEQIWVQVELFTSS